MRKRRHFVDDLLHCTQRFSQSDCSICTFYTSSSPLKYLSYQRWFSEHMATLSNSFYNVPGYVDKPFMVPGMTFHWIVNFQTLKAMKKTAILFDQLIDTRKNLERWEIAKSNKPYNTVWASCKLSLMFPSSSKSNPCQSSPTSTILVPLGLLLSL